MTTKIIPKTKTPKNVYYILVVMIIILGLFLYYLIGIFGIILLFVFLGFSTPLYTEGKVPTYHALILVNSITGAMRTVFPGINFKLPWENAQKNEAGEKDYKDLRVELREVCEETYASQDALMETKYVYTVRPNLSGDNPGKDVILFYSFEPDAIKSKTRAKISMLLSDHYGKSEGEKLLNKQFINENVLGTDENPSKVIEKLEEILGAEITACLEDSDFDKATQKFRDMISGAKSFDAAIQKLIAGGRDPKQAEKILKLMHFDGYTETDFNLNVDAPHLTNVRDITVLGGLGSTKGGKK
jgi:hypothetical protein